MRQVSGSAQSDCILADLDEDAVAVIALDRCIFCAVDNQRIEKPEAANGIVAVTCAVDIDRTYCSIIVVSSVDGIITLAAYYRVVGAAVFNEIVTRACVYGSVVAVVILDRIITVASIYRDVVTVVAINVIVASARAD